MAKRVSKEERETIIRFDETDGPVVIYTFNADLKKRLKSFAKKHPELCTMSKEDRDFAFDPEDSRDMMKFIQAWSVLRRRYYS